MKHILPLMIAGTLALAGCGNNVTSGGNSASTGFGGKVTLPADGYSFGGRFRSGPATSYDQPFSRNFAQPVKILRDTGIEQSQDNGEPLHWFEVETRQGRAYQPGIFLCLPKGRHKHIQACPETTIAAAKKNANK